MQNYIQLMLDTHGVCTDAHKLLITKLENEIKTYEDACKILEADGFLVYNSKGEVSKHPAIMIRQKSTDLIKLILAELKLTPKSSTVTNKAKSVPKDSSLAEFLPVGT